MWGAERRTAMVVMMVKVVKVIRQNLNKNTSQEDRSSYSEKIIIQRKEQL
jgi:hypothetical protein